MDSPSLSKVTTILDRYLNLKGVYSKENAFRYLQIILEGRQEYGFKSSTELRTIDLTITSLNAVGAPLEMGKIVDRKLKAGIAAGMGDADWSTIYELTRKEAGLS